MLEDATIALRKVMERFAPHHLHYIAAPGFPELEDDSRAALLQMGRGALIGYFAEAFDCEGVDIREGAVAIGICDIPRSYQGDVTGLADAAYIAPYVALKGALRGVQGGPAIHRFKSDPSLTTLERIMGGMSDAAFARRSYERLMGVAIEDERIRASVGGGIIVHPLAWNEPLLEGVARSASYVDFLHEGAYVDTTIISREPLLAKVHIRYGNPSNALMRAIESAVV